LLSFLGVVGSLPGEKQMDNSSIISFFPGAFIFIDMVRRGASRGEKRRLSQPIEHESAGATFERPNGPVVNCRTEHAHLSFRGEFPLLFPAIGPKGRRGCG
jgi:hypothetical protein